MKHFLNVQQVHQFLGQEDLVATLVSLRAFTAPNSEQSRRLTNLLELTCHSRITPSLDPETAVSSNRSCRRSHEL